MSRSLEIMFSVVQSVRKDLIFFLMFLDNELINNRIIHCSRRLLKEEKVILRRSALVENRLEYGYLSGN